MNERDCYFYWIQRGLDGPALIKQAELTIKQLPKTPTAKSMKHGFAKSISLHKAYSYWLLQNGAKWARWAYLGLHEDDYMKESGDPPIHVDKEAE